MDLESFPGEIKRISLHLSISQSDINIESVLNSLDFDIHLNGSDKENGIYDWVVGSFSPIKTKTIEVFKINSQIKEDENISLAFEIIGFDQEISNGEIDLLYNNTPNKISISSPYPNPFNPITSIDYTIAEKSNLSIEVYNLQGRIINKIVKDRIDPGYYTFNWDGTNEPSGIYIIKVQISDTIKIYRTVLIK